jgi:hypothetical protein
MRFSAGLAALLELVRYSMPDIDSLLARLFAGTSFLYGHFSDYVLACIIAAAFPLMRLLLDKTIYEVTFFVLRR